MIWVVLFLAVSFIEAGASGGSSSDLQIVERWLQSNAKTRSLRVEFVQSRALKAIKNPLVQPGVLWLDYETGRFRWQLGDPAKTIVVSRENNQIAVLRTPLKRVEFREAGGQGSGAPGLARLAQGFPKTLEEFQKRYRVLEVVAKGNAYEIAVQPEGPQGEAVSRFGFVIDQTRYLLKGLVIDLKDGSRITTTFQRVERNGKIEQSVFQPDLRGYRETKFRSG